MENWQDHVLKKQSAQAEGRRCGLLPGVAMFVVASGLVFTVFTLMHSRPAPAALKQQQAMVSPRQVEGHLPLVTVSMRQPTSNKHKALLRRGSKDTIASKDAPANDTQFAKQIVREVVRDEVESFLHKVNLVSRVGAYVATRVRED